VSSRGYCAGVSENLRNYTKAIYTMDAVVQRFPETMWDLQSPCDGWTAREVLGHFIWGTKNLVSLATGGPKPAEQPEADVAGTDAHGAWATARDNVLAAVDQPGALQKGFDGPFGPTTVDGFLGIHTMDCMIHAWDIAKTVGHEAYLPADIAAAALPGMRALGDGIRSPGLFGPEVDVPADADPVSQLLGITGRQP
jgi:uncharacterized protein (TIGR03086 family)